MCCSGRLSIFPWLLAVGVLMTAAAQETDSEESKNASGLTHEQRQEILRHFRATTKDFDENSALTLVYDFEKMREDLAEDWLPDLRKGKGRVRWTQPGEGSHEGVSGVLIANRGQWTHKAVWTSAGLDVSVEMMPMSSSRKDDLIAATFRHPKGKKVVGTNGGTQIVSIRGVRAVASFPNTPPEFAYNRRMTFGYQVEKDLFTATVANSPRADSAPMKGFMKKLPNGRVGIVWNAQVNSIIATITIRGKLDPTWVKKVVEK